MRLYFTLLLCLVWNDVEVDARNPVTVVRENSEKSCRGQGKEVYKTKDDWCCTCSPGQYKHADCMYGKPTSTHCLPCPFDPDDSGNQTYMDVQNNAMACIKALNESSCDAYMNMVYVIGSTTSNARCVCKGGHFISQDGIEYGCARHSQCEPGFYAYELGTNSSNTKCKPCPDGTFSDVPSSTTTCTPWTKCGQGQIEHQKGNSTADTTCITEKPDSLNLENVTYQADSVMKHTTAEATSTAEPRTTRIGTEPAYKQSLGGLGVTGIIAVSLSVMFAIIVFLMVVCLKRCKAQKNEHSESDLKKPLQGAEQENLLSDGDVQRTVLSCQEINENDTEIQESPHIVECMKNSSNCDPNPCTKSPNVPVTDPCPLQFETTFTDLFHAVDLMKAQKDGILNCCVRNAFKDHKIGNALLKCLLRFRLQDVKQFARNFLEELVMGDVEEDYKKAEEIRIQLVNKISSMHGRMLTPEFIFGKDFESNEIKDLMFDIFFKSVRKCH